MNEKSKNISCLLQFDKATYLLLLRYIITFLFYCIASNDIYYIKSL